MLSQKHATLFSNLRFLLLTALEFPLKHNFRIGAKLAMQKFLERVEERASRQPRTVPVLSALRHRAISEVEFQLQLHKFPKVPATTVGT
jgi:hypothetical protein